MKCKLAVLGLLAWAFLSMPALGHEVRPAYLEINQSSETSFRVTWKQPTLGDIAIHLNPHLSNGWLGQRPADQYAAGGYLVRTWNITDRSRHSVFGQTVSIEGLADTMTDVLVRVRLANEQKFDAILRPSQPSVRIALQNGNQIDGVSFVILGIEHILTGPDHLFFVLGLLLIVRNRWSLLRTVSAFTLGHSITLAAATLGFVWLSVPLVNALIALSILFLAPEVLRLERGETSLTVRFPWVVAAMFGLVHGLGFASSLTALGLARETLVKALLLFNCGVEIGQIAFIVVMLSLLWLFRRLKLEWPSALRHAPTYAIGTLGAFWAIQGSAILFGAL